MKKYIILVLLLIISIPCSVKASDGNLSIECPSTSKGGEVLNCTVRGNSENDIDSIEATINLSENLTYESFTLNKDLWDGDDFDNQKIEIYSKSGNPINGNFDVGVLKLKTKSVVNKNEIVTLKDIGFSYGENNSQNNYTISNVTSNIRVPNNECKLGSLSLTGGTITFNDTTTEYALEINNTETTISATAKDSNATVTGTGPKNLNYGLNTITVTVTAEDGTKKNYVLKVTRPDNRDSSKDLIGFGFINYDIKFDKKTVEYSLLVEYEVEKLALCDKASNGVLCIDSTKLKYSDKATIKMLLNDKEYTDGQVELKVGKNILEVIVKAENETEKTYTFNINRKDAKGNVVSTPQTGDSTIIIIGVLLVVSLVLGVYFYKKRKKCD